MNAQFSSGTLAVFGTGRHAEIFDASLPNDAATTSGPAAVLDARESLGTRTSARDHRTFAANDRRRVPGECVRAEAVGLVIADLADSVGPAEALDLAGVLAAVLRAGLF